MSVVKREISNQDTSRRISLHGKQPLTLQLYRKIHYLTREFRVKLHAKTDIAKPISHESRIA